MEEKKGPPRFGGSKVSEIANIFQARQVTTQKEDILTPLRHKPKTIADKLENNETSPTTVTVVRTESHVTRFNNARAMFEKLGEENRNSRERIIPLQSTKSASSILDSRSRSSSANSETRDTKSHDEGSRSPSPKRREKYNTGSVPELNDNNMKPKTNGFNKKSTNGNEVVLPTKPALMKKPEKPERKFNSKELIEKQRNWTSHFSKTRTNRYNSDPNKSELKYGANNGNNDNNNRPNVLATRSASFNNRLRSPPESPPSPPVRTEASKRTNLQTRKERPASVIPTTYTSPTKREFNSPESSPTTLTSPSDVIPAKKCLFKDDNKMKSEDLNEKVSSRENLSATSGSLSSLSPPSSPNKLKSEQEKQEQEGNEKFDMGSKFYFLLFLNLSCIVGC